MIGEVTLSTRAPALAVRALLDGSARVSGGYSTWEVIERPRRIGVPVWRGMAPYALTLPLLLDGWREARSVEPEIRTLERMARIVADVGRAPALRIDGPVPHAKGPEWVITGLEWGDQVVRSTETEERLRQDVVVTVLQHLEADLALTRPASAAKRQAAKRAAAKKPAARTYVVRAGDTLASIAARLLGKAARWTEIRRLNPQIRDPSRITAGQRLKVPAR